MIKRKQWKLYSRTRTEVGANDHEQAVNPLSLSPLQEGCHLLLAVYVVLYMHI